MRKGKREVEGSWRGKLLDSIVQLKLVKGQRHWRKQRLFLSDHEGSAKRTV